MLLFEFQQNTDQARALLLVNDRLAVLFDPEGEVHVLLESIRNSEALLAAIVLTDPHTPSNSCAEALREHTGAGIYSLFEGPAVMEVETLVAGDTLELGQVKVNLVPRANGTLEIQVIDAQQKLRAKIQHAHFQILEA